MPIPASNSATDASLPPHAGGSGSGRPWSRPCLAGLGPRPKVPGQARDGVATLFAACLLSLPAHAQVVPTGTPAADILLSRAIGEQRLYLTCSALMGETHDMLVALWRKDIAQAAAILTENGVPVEAIAAFQSAANPEALLPAPDTPFDAVRALCATDPDWVDTVNRLDMTRLADSLPEAFQ